MKTARNAIRLLREFLPDVPKLGVSELSRRLDLDRATVHRMLRTLLDERFIEQETETRLYRLGPGVLELAQGFLRQNGIVAVAMPHLERLRDLTEETVGLKILDGRQSVCIATCESRHPVRVNYYVGERIPIHCTSSGFIFLSSMTPAARKSFLSGKLRKYTPKTIVDPAKIEDTVAETLRGGFGFTGESYLPGACALSAPIRGPRKDLVAVVSVVAPTHRVTLKRLMGFAEPVKGIAHGISEAIAAIGTIAMPIQNPRRGAR